MSGVRAAQQIGNLLTQSGIPAPMSLDIAQRLLTISSDQSSNSRLIDSSSAESVTNALRNRFKPPEQPFLDSLEDRAAKDGLPGRNGKTGSYYFSGLDGAAGQDGQRGQDGVVDYERISAMISQMIAQIISQMFGGILIGGIPFNLKKILERLDSLEERMKNLENKHDKLRREFDKLKKAFDSLKAQVDKIQRQLDEAVECPEADV